MESPIRLSVWNYKHQISVGHIIMDESVLVDSVSDDFKIKDAEEYTLIPLEPKKNALKQLYTLYEEIRKSSVDVIDNIRRQSELVKYVSHLFSYKEYTKIESHEELVKFITEANNGEYEIVREHVLGPEVEEVLKEYRSNLPNKSLREDNNNTNYEV